MMEMNQADFSGLSEETLACQKTVDQNAGQLTAEPAEFTVKKPEKYADPGSCLPREGVAEPLLLKSVPLRASWSISAPKKLTYKVFIYTGGDVIHNFFLTLVNSYNESSDKTPVKKSGEEIIVDISTIMMMDLGDIVQVKLEMDSSMWYCKKIRVKAPSGKFFEFPCYRWIKDSELIIREGSARLPQDETGWLQKQREKELDSRQKIFRWGQWSPGFPRIMDSEQNDLHPDIQFDKEKQSHFIWNSIKVFFFEKIYDKFKGYTQPWEDIEHFEQILKNYCLNNTLLENVIQDWNTDYMFGYQFLNGCNPVMISKCKKLPNNFPVTHEMVKGSLQRHLTLEEELEKGNIYIVNYEILEGLKANKSCYLAAPICLLYNNRLNQIVPIAIQLSQTSEVSPIFLPSDHEYDWTLAKMWVKSADFNVHQLVTHLLKTHLILEVFEVAIHRHLSVVHPVYKLLMPHVRFTIAINAAARKSLISEDGIFSKIYYDSDEAVVKDVEIQKFVKDISYGIKDKTENFPKTLKSRAELAEYLTAVIFTGSAQHAAVNFGQFDWYGWIPNSPSTMRKEPPEHKGTVKLDVIMKTLPDRDCSTLVLGTVWNLSRFQTNERFLGIYPDMYFTEQAVKEAIKTFRKNLDDVTDQIKSRNKTITMKYCYLSPDQIPNSVTI